MILFIFLACSIYVTFRCLKKKKKKNRNHNEIELGDQKGAPSSEMIAEFNREKKRPLFPGKDSANEKPWILYF